MKRKTYLLIQVNFLIIFAVISVKGQHVVNEPIQIIRGSNGQSSFITINHDPWIWSTQNIPTFPYPFRDVDLGHLVIQPRTSAPRDILFVTGDGDDIRMSIKGDGNIGIGTTTPTNKLEVNGTIRSKEVKVEASPWPDFVFTENHNLPDLREIDTYIRQNGHLPEIPTAKEVEENGIGLGEMNAKLLQKIEELTLYVIELKKENEEQDRVIEGLLKK